jgi:hypothetical protein
MRWVKELLLIVCDRNLLTPLIRVSKRIKRTLRAKREGGDKDSECGKGIHINCRRVVDKCGGGCDLRELLYVNRKVAGKSFDSI